MRRISLHVVTLLAAAAVLAPASASAASWTTQTTNAPGGALSSKLNGVHCTSTTACTAVGGYEDASNVDKALAVRWNGASWATQTPPFPAGAISAELAGVHCTSSTACRAVGTFKDSGNIDRTFAAAWNGVAWSQDTTPNPAGSLGAYLSGISCTAANACTAVGAYIDSGGVLRALAQRWNGSTWSTQSTPTPGSATATALTGVACTSSSGCHAVGEYVDGGVRLTLAMTWNGTSWSVQATPNPASHTGSGLSAISCTSSNDCTAVGASLNALRVSQALAMRWNGASWALQSPVLPAGQTGAGFSGVSCTSGTHCTATGYSHNNLNVLSTLAEAWDGTNWSVQATPNPASSTDPRLTGVSCTSSAFCEAGGWYLSGGVQRAFAEKWN